MFLQPILLKGGTVPELRAAGIGATGAPLVALTEDHCIFDREWLQALVREHAKARYPVIGGAVENVPEDRSGLDWAVYFYDYGRYLQPQDKTSQPAAMLSGINVCYRRSDLEKVMPSYASGFVETGVHTALQSTCGSLRFAPAALVHHAKRYRFSAAVREAFTHGRIHGGARPRSLARGLMGASLLPLLTPARVASAILRGHRTDLITPLLRAFAPLVLLTSCWGAGEVLGYLAGPGSSQKHWK